MNILTSVSRTKPIHDFYTLTFISLRHKYVYVAVGKAANSTVKYHLFNLEYRGTRFTPRSVHDRQSAPLLSPYQLPHDLLQHIFTSPEYYKFTIVRNPYTRLLSCYLDRIQRKAGLAYRQLIRNMNKSVGDDVTFEEFIVFVCAQPPYEQNLHWRLQTAEICHDTIAYDLIGKQETFSESMSTVWASICPDEPTPSFIDSNKSPSRTSAHQRILDFYTPDLLNLVRTAYADDFKTFCYPHTFQLDKTQ
jgi:hypothetical protein